MAQRTPVAAGESMSESVESMLSGLGTLDPERAVLAAMARQLAGPLDGMSRSMRARMSGQTAGQLLKVLDKLGVPRRAPTPAVDAAPVAAGKPPDEVWYEGIEDTLYAEKIAWLIQRHAERSGGRLPRPGTAAYAAAPWAVDPWEYVRAQKGPRWPRRLLP